MNKSIVAAALIASALGTPAVATTSKDAAPFRMRHIEATMPQDPYLSPLDSVTEPHYSPAADLAPAAQVIDGAIPAGTPLDSAVEMLRTAGAHCRQQDSNAVSSCTYFDIQASGEHIDSVHWKINLLATDGKLDRAELQRWWTRQEGD